MRVVVTGGAGFLGWHARAAMLLDPDIDVVSVARPDWLVPALARHLSRADAVLHLAGLNRGDDLEADNVALADDLIAALDLAGQKAPLPRVVYAGSTYACDDHPGRDSPYGLGKRVAGERLREWGTRREADVAEVRLPGLFGEHGRPEYNSFVATFAHRIAAGETPRVEGDRELPLLPVQDAVRLLLDAARTARGVSVSVAEGTPMRISAVADTLRGFHDLYAPTGDIPDLTGPLAVPLFNTLRAAMWPQAYPLRPQPRSDQRGSLVETVRVHGGTGQAFVSTTNPGFVRGEHVHTTKIERFQVLSGTGLIRLRRLLHTDVVEFDVTGDEPAVVDMPTWWTHSIENIGSGPLVTAFWANELFDPERPDTYPLPVDSRDVEDHHPDPGSAGAHPQHPPHAGASSR